MIGPLIWQIPTGKNHFTWAYHSRIFRTDSDVVRSFGSISHTLALTRFDPRNGRLLESNEDHSNRLRIVKLSSKDPYHTLWFVSNCDHTWGAIERWKLGQALIEEGTESKNRTAWKRPIHRKLAGAKTHASDKNFGKGLKLQGEGKCFDKPSDRDFSSFVYGKPSKNLPVHRFKFYLAFENAFHCTDQG